MKTNLKYFNQIVSLALLLPVLGGCLREPADATLAPPPPPSVTVSRPLEKRVTRLADFTGTTEAIESVTIRARVEGVLETIHFTAGDVVNEGDLLYSIDPKPFRTRLEEAHADLAIRRAELQLAETTSHRREKAFRDKAVSEVAMIEARANLAAAKAAVGAAEAAVQRSALDLSYTQIEAPIGGRIGRSLVDAGNLVGAGERTRLTAIVRDDPIYAYFSVNERDLLEYRQMDGTQPSPASDDTPVFMGLSNQVGYPFEGRVDYMDNRMDAGSGTIRIRAIFPNPDHQLIPGLFARVQVPIGHADMALLVPESALIRDQRGSSLLVADENNIVGYRPVTVGPLIDGMRVISQGIALQDRVVTNGLQKARPGAVVTPEEKAPSASNRSEAPQPSA